MLPDTSTGQSPGIPPEAGPESCHAVPPCEPVEQRGCKEGMPCPADLSGCGGTSLIGTANLSPVTNLVAGTGPASGGAVQTISKPEIYHGTGF